MGRDLVIEPCRMNRLAYHDTKKHQLVWVCVEQLQFRSEAPSSPRFSASFANSNSCSAF